MASGITRRRCVRKDRTALRGRHVCGRGRWPCRIIQSGCRSRTRSYRDRTQRCIGVSRLGVAEFRDAGRGNRETVWRTTRADASCNETALRMASGQHDRSYATAQCVERRLAWIFSRVSTGLSVTTGCGEWFCSRSGGPWRTIAKAFADLFRGRRSHPVVASW